VMPDLSGLELIQRLRKVDPEVRVVAMTGHAPGGPGDGLEEAEGVEVLRKPLEVAALAETVRRALEGD
jgi:DNA-binding NtrC family response regulator